MNTYPDHLKTFAPIVGKVIYYFDAKNENWHKGIVTKVEENLVYWDYDTPYYGSKNDEAFWTFVWEENGKHFWILNPRLRYDFF